LNGQLNVPGIARDGRYRYTKRPGDKPDFIRFSTDPQGLLYITPDLAYLFVEPEFIMNGNVNGRFNIGPALI
jgi:hypothetical protein